MVGTLDAAERQALDLLAQRRRAFESLIERRRAAEQAVKDREAERHAKAAALEEALKPIAALRQQVEAQVRASPEWAAQRARIDQRRGHRRRGREKGGAGRRRPRGQAQTLRGRSAVHVSVAQEVRHGRGPLGAAGARSSIAMSPGSSVTTRPAPTTRS